MSGTTTTLADVLAELRLLRAELHELRQSTATTTQPRARLVTATELAAELGVSRDWIYQHRDDLGAVRIGDGPKARLRFDIDAARQAIGARSQASGQPQTHAAPRRRSKPSRQTGAGLILKVRKHP